MTTALYLLGSPSQAVAQNLRSPTLTKQNIEFIRKPNPGVLNATGDIRITPQGAIPAGSLLSAWIESAPLPFPGQPQPFSTGPKDVAKPTYDMRHAVLVWDASSGRMETPGPKTFKNVPASATLLIRLQLFTNGVAGEWKILRGVDTPPPIPSGYTENEEKRSGTSVTFEGGTTIPPKNVLGRFLVVRRFYASTSSSLPISNGQATDLEGYAGVEAPSIKYVHNPPKDPHTRTVKFTGLSPETEYWFFVVDHDTSTGLFSQRRLGPVTTLAAGQGPEEPDEPDEPTGVYVVDEARTTTTSITFKNGPPITEGFDRRAFSIAVDKFARALKNERNISRRGSHVGFFQTVQASAGVRTFTMGPPLRKLKPNTEYAAYFRDFVGLGNNPRSSGQSEVFSGWTKPNAPSGHDNPMVTANSVTFANAGLMGGLSRLYFISTSPLTFGGTNTPVDAVGGQVQSGTVGGSDVVDGAVTFGGSGIRAVLEANRKYYFYFMDRNGSSRLSSAPLRRVATPSAVPELPDPPRDEPAPDAPRLEAKAGALTRNAQTYVATFGDGALYYLVQTGEYSSQVTAANVRTTGTSGGAESPKDIVLGSLQAGKEYTLYAIVEHNNAQSGVAHKTFTTTAAQVPDPPRDEPTPDAPRLEAKAGALTRNAQTYLATFGDGTLYYLVQTGEYSSQVTAANVRTTGTSGGAESPKDIVLGSLQAGEEYTLYAIVEHNNAQSPVASQTFTTLAAPVRPPGDGAAPDAPTLTVKLGSLTHNAQTYTATFSSGTLYYLHKEGSYDDSVTVTNIKAANKSLDATGDVALSGLTADTQYTLYAFVEHNNAQSPVASQTFTTLAAEDESAVAKPVYTVNSEGVTATTLPLTKKDGVSDASQELNRLFGVKKDTAPSSEELENFGDDPDIRRNNPFDCVFQVNTAGDVVIGNEKGAGSQPLSGNQTNAPLTPNTKYFVYVLDWKGGDNTGISEAHHVTAPDGAWTLPAEVEIAEPRQNSGCGVETPSAVSVAPDTKIHWVVLDRNEQLPMNLTGTNIKEATRGKNIIAGVRWATVENKGALSSTGKITNLLGNISGSYVLYYVVEGTISGLFSAVQKVGFRGVNPDCGWNPYPFGLKRDSVVPYPNPTSGVLHVPISEGVAKIYASDGAQVGSFVILAGQIDLSDLPAGDYIVRLSDGSVLRVVKQ